MSHLRIHLLFLFALLFAGACSSATPKMKVLGVKAQAHRFEQPSMKVFVEVHNPTNGNLNLSKLQYRLTAKKWFDSKGVVSVRRTITAGASAVVEILVPVTEALDPESMRGVAYTLDARLFATANKTERSWKLSAAGALADTQSGRVRPTQVADRY